MDTFILANLATIVMASLIGLAVVGAFISASLARPAKVRRSKFHTTDAGMWRERK